MMKRKLQRRRRGFVLLMVLFILLALGLAVTAYYTQSEDHLFMGQSMGAYTIAASRAQLGAQTALSQIRNGSLSLLPITAACADGPGIDVFATCGGSLSTGIIGGMVDNGNTRELRLGGGLQYNYVIYRPLLAGANQNLYTIRSIGYYGYALTSTNLFSSELEVTVEVGSSTVFNCKSYDCS